MTTATSRRLTDGPALHAAYGVSESTLRTWASRELIGRYGKDRRRRTLYDVAEVERVLGVSPAAESGDHSDLGGCLMCRLPAYPGSPVPLCVPHLTAAAEFGSNVRLTVVETA
jgi:hypothetical protein